MRFLNSLGGLCCVVWTYILLVQSQVTSTLVLIHYRRLGIALPVIGIALHSILLTLAIWAHYVCMTVDPGVIPMIKDPQIVTDALNFNFSRCTKCQVLRPLRSHHCRTCNACIIRMDHHCPWINNCVGFFNIKFFLLYTSYIWILGLFDITLAISIIVEAVSLSKFIDNVLGFYGIRWLVAVAIMGITATTFCIFCFVMIADQGLEFEKREFASTMAMLFGGRFSVGWFFPINTHSIFFKRPLTESDVLTLACCQACNAVLT